MKFKEMILEGAPKVPLETLVDFVRAVKSEELPDSFRYYGTGDFWNDKSTLESPKTAPGRARMLLNKGDLLYRTAFPTHKGAVYIDENLDKQVASTGFTQMRTNNIADAKYLAYALTSLQIWNYIRQNSAGILDAVQGKAFRQTLIDLPPLEVQQQVVTILDAYSELAELQAERVRLLKLEKDVLLEKIFAPEGGFKFSLNGRSFDTAEWNLRKIEEIAIFSPERKPSLPESFIYLDISSVKEGKVVQEKIVSRDAAPGRATWLLREGDVIYQAVRPYFRNAMIVDEKYGGQVASNGFIHLRPNGSTSEFLHAIMSSSLLAAIVEPLASGSNYAVISEARLKSILIPMPKKEDQQLISDYFREVDHRIKLEEERLQLLKTQQEVALEQIFSK